MGCALTGCVEQTLSVDSNPPGAIVYLNDQEVGRTPFETNFKWYGTYDVTLRKEGYTTLKTQAKVIAPAWNWIPLDLFAALWPTTFMDKHDLQFTLKPLSETEVDPARLVRRGERLRTELESGVSTRGPVTRPVNTPRPATRVAPTAADKVVLPPPAP